ncbi:MAG: hypothetical protein ACLQBD_10675 [Syntrophobacteraceae bacterium]
MNESKIAPDRGPTAIINQTVLEDPVISIDQPMTTDPMIGAAWNRLCQSFRFFLHISMPVRRSLSLLASRFSLPASRSFFYHSSLLTAP